MGVTFTRRTINGVCDIGKFRGFTLVNTITSLVPSPGYGKQGGSSVIAHDPDLISGEIYYHGSWPASASAFIYGLRRSSRRSRRCARGLTWPVRLACWPYHRIHRVVASRCAPPPEDCCDCPEDFSKEVIYERKLNIKMWGVNCASQDYSSRRQKTFVPFTSLEVRRERQRKIGQLVGTFFLVSSSPTSSLSTPASPVAPFSLLVLYLVSAGPLYSPRSPTLSFLPVLCLSPTFRCLHPPVHCPPLSLILVSCSALLSVLCLDYLSPLLPSSKPTLKDTNQPTSKKTIN